jgi:ATP-binding cassette, subfamily C, bacterial CydC
MRDRRAEGGGGHVTATLRRLVALAPPPWARLALSVILGAAAVVCGIGLMATAGYLIARAAERPAVLSLTTAIVAVRFFGLGRPVARYLERLAAHDVAFRLLARIRVRFYERIEPLAPAELDAFRKGDLLARMVGDVDALQSVYLRGLGPAMVGLAVGAASVAVAAAILPGAALVMAAGLLAGATVVPLVSWRLGRAAADAAAARGTLSAELVELLRGAPELLMCGAEASAMARLGEVDRTVARLSRRDGLAAGVSDGLSIAVTGVTVTGVLAVAASARSAGTIDGVLVAALALLCLASFDAVTPLPQATRELSATLAAGRRVLEIADREARVRDPEGQPPVPSSRPTFALEDVTAHYPAADRLVLHGVSLTLAPGRKVALVGPSGSGKTTVANLLLRFLDPADGRVTLDRRDLRDYRQADVRNAIALAGQDSHLFATSIRENVRIGNPAATDAELEDALRRARISEWVATLPDGMDTLVGEEGTWLSGGQRQRIGLARAFLADAPLLILDEPTAHLDPMTARALMDDVIEALGGRTLLLITHRPEGLERMDEVVELDGGRLARTA